MTKMDLCRMVSQASGVDIGSVIRAVDAMVGSRHRKILGYLPEVFLEGNGIEIRGWGRFRVRFSSPTAYANPRTGAKCSTPERYMLKWRWLPPGTFSLNPLIPKEQSAQ